MTCKANLVILKNLGQQLNWSSQVELGGNFILQCSPWTFSSSICYIRGTTTTKLCTSAFYYCFSTACQTTCKLNIFKWELEERNMNVISNNIVFLFLMILTKIVMKFFAQLFVKNDYVMLIFKYCLNIIQQYYPWLWEWDKVYWAIIFCLNVWTCAPR